MGLFDFIGPASGLLFTLENIIWINLGVFIGCVFAAIPGLSVILCIILFLPVTYTMKAIPGMMFLLGIYCAGGYGGSVSAILINTPRGGYYAGRSSTVQDGPHQGGVENCTLCIYLWRYLLCAGAALPRPSGRKNFGTARHGGVLYGLPVRHDDYCRRFW